MNEHLFSSMKYLLVIRKKDKIMATLYSIIRYFYHILPDGLRKNLILSTVSRSISSFFPSHHNHIYTKEFFLKDVEDASLISAPIIAEHIISKWKPRRVIDVGCGTGALLEALRKKGNCYCLGLDFADPALEICRSRDLEVEKFNIERDSFKQSIRFDIAISLEVAEHLSERNADRYVELLTDLAPVVVLSAAGPGQEGTGHVNIQPKKYWITKFANRCFRYDEKLSIHWSHNWRDRGVAHWYYSNLMIFLVEPDRG